jgi:transcription initiation factor IIE alpha subunit
MISNGKVKQAVVKPTIRQKVWNYMRRNRIFVIADVMAITGANYKNLREMFKVYEHTGYIKVVRRGKPFTSTQLKLIKCTGVKVPTHDKARNILFDYNTKEEIEIKFPSSLEKVLSCLDKSLVTKEGIEKATKLSGATVQKVYAKLKELEIMIRVVPTRRNTFGYRLFNIDVALVKKLKEDIQSQIINPDELLKQKVERPTAQQKEPYCSEFLISALSAMTKEKMTLYDIASKAGIEPHHVKAYLKRFAKHGIMSQIIPTEKDGRKVIWKIDIQKAKDINEKVKIGKRL